MKSCGKSPFHLPPWGLYDEYEKSLILSVIILAHGWRVRLLCLDAVCPSIHSVQFVPLSWKKLCVCVVLIKIMWRIPFSLPLGTLPPWGL